MYLSQTAITIVLLAFLTSTIFYQTIEMKTNDVENTIEIKKQALFSDIVKSKVENNIDKIVNEVFVNISYEIINKDRNFFNSSEDAENAVETEIKQKLNNTIITLNYSTIKLENINFTIAPNNNDPTKILATYNIKIKYSKKINNVEIEGYKIINETNKEIQLNNMPDPYVYRNDFYYDWSYKTDIIVNNMPNTGNHIFYIKLNNSNFDYSKMYNSNLPTEIRVIGANDKLLPYWIQSWREGPDKTSIIWVNCNKNELINTGGTKKLEIIYNSTSNTDRQNPENTFIFFDDFNGFGLDENKWNINGNYHIDNGILTVTDISTIKSIDTFDYKELIFKGNISENNNQSIGFIDINNVNNKIYFNYTINNIYTVIGNTPNLIGDSSYLNNYYIYNIKRNNINNANFEIYNTTLNLEESNNMNPGFANSLPIVIYRNNINGAIKLDWIFVKDINSITTTVTGGSSSNINYNELKPTSTTNTFYYGDATQYNLVPDGRYSIIGIFTNATDSWGNIGYKPIIEN